MPVVYALGLLVAFYALVTAEILSPSGGLLAVTAFVTAITSVVIGWTYSGTFALTLLLVYLLTTPALFGLLIRMWPKTRIGRNMLNRDTLRSESDEPPPVTLDGVPLADLVGRFGKATCDLLPHGQVKIENHKAAAVSTGMPIDTGTLVEVVRVVGREVQVRQATAEELEAWQQNRDRVSEEPAPPPAIPSLDAPQPSGAGEDASPVATSLEEIDLDDIDLSGLDPPDKT